MHTDIHKAGGILIKDRRFLVTRNRGKDIFYAPGGKLEKSESPEEALIRELKEELSITVEEKDLEPFGTFTAPSAGDESHTIEMQVFRVNAWQGTITPTEEIKELAWISSTPPPTMKLGSIFGHKVLPRLKQQGLIE